MNRIERVLIELETIDGLMEKAYKKHMNNFPTTTNKELFNIWVGVKFEYLNFKSWSETLTEEKLHDYLDDVDLELDANQELIRFETRIAEEYAKKREFQKLKEDIINGKK